MSAEQWFDNARSAARAWSILPMATRRLHLRQFAAAIAEQQQTLVEAIVQDTAKPALDALGGDVLVTLEQARYYDRHAHRLLRTRNGKRDWLIFSGTRFEEHLEPHGVVLVYGASNYPLQLGLVPAITALYAGNAVILKLSEKAPALTHMLRKLAAETLPAGVLQILNDPPEVAGDLIDHAPDFICFTGSSRNGAQVATRAGQRLIPTLLELGGKDAALVFADCNIERTVEGVLYGAFCNSGRVCVGIKRLYVEESLYSRFVDDLVARTNQLSLGATDTSEGDIIPLRATDLPPALTPLIHDAIAHGATVLNNTDDLSGATPLLLGNVPNNHPLWHEEVFAPVVCVAPFQNEQDAIAKANDNDFALGASIWTNDSSKATRIARQLHAANVSVNDVIRAIANPATPFGGNGRSGYGRYHGEEGLRTFSRTKIVMHASARSKSQRNWFPFTNDKYKLLSKLIRLRHSRLGRWFALLITTSVLIGTHWTASQGISA